MPISSPAMPVSVTERNIIHATHISTATDRVPNSAAEKRQPRGEESPNST